MRKIESIGNLRKLKERYFLPKYLRDMKSMQIGGLSGGNSAEIIVNGDSCFTEFIREIKKARLTVNIETYIFNSDNVGWMIARELAKAAVRGVEVNLIYDAVGSIQSNAAIFSHMRESGVEIIPYNPPLGLKRLVNINLRDHRKILVIDGRTAFVGGINIGREYAGKKFKGGHWRDTHVRIKGPAVKDIQYFFMENFIRSGGYVKDFSAYFPDIKSADDKIVMILSNKSRRNKKPIKESYLSAIRNAKKYVCITNAYFVPDANIYRSLVRAAERGVEVSLILPRKTDIPIVRYAGMYLYKRYLRHGIRIFEYCDSVLHAKTAVIDGIWSTIGSSNLDRRSINYNLEINAVVLDQEFGCRMKEIFENDKKKSIELTIEKYRKRSIWRFFLEWFFYRFRKFL